MLMQIAGYGNCRTAYNAHIIKIISSFFTLVTPVRAGVSFATPCHTAVSGPTKNKIFRGWHLPAMTKEPNKRFCKTIFVIEFSDIYNTAGGT